MTIRSKFLASAAAVAVLLVSLLTGGLFVLLGAKKAETEQRQAARELVGDVRGASHWWNKAEDEIQTLIIFGAEAEGVTEIRDAALAYESRMAALEPRLGEAPELAALQAGRAALHDLVDRIAEMEAQEPEAAAAGLRALLVERIQALHQLDDDMEAAFEALLATASAEEDLAMARVDRALRLIELFGFGIAGLVLLVIGGQFVVMIRPLLRSILHVVDGVVRIGAGELDHRLEARTGDEIQQLSEEVNRMAARLGASYREVEAARDQAAAYSAALKNEMENGRRLQQNFLPDSLPTTPGWEIAATLSPARDVSGDFYDAFVLSNGMVGLVIGDVCDKGVGSALFMALSRSLLRVFASQAGEDASATLRSTVERTNDYIAETHSDTNMFTTLFVAFLDSATGDLLYINAGHEAPAVLAADGAVRDRLRPTGPAVGLFPGAPYEVGHFTLKPGDTLFAYTDGVTDARSPTGENFGERRLLELVAGAPSRADARLRQLDATVREHIAGAVQFDDITILLARRSPVGAEAVHAGADGADARDAAAIASRGGHVQ
jgi:serine phosphatase RsbU (regulator of sigma subunit)